MRSFRLAAAVAALSITLPATAQTTQQDLPRRNLDVAWPAGLDPARADVFNHHELLIEAGCDPVYRKLAAPAG